MTARFDPSAFTPAAPAADARARKEAGTGVLLGIGAYLAWGFLPVYLKAVGSVPAPDLGTVDGPDGRGTAATRA